MFIVTSLNKTKSCSFFLFLQFMYSKLKKISFYIILAPLLNNPTSAPGYIFSKFAGYEMLFSFSSLFFLFFPFIIFSFQSLLDPLCQALRPSHQDFFTVCLHAFPLFFLLLSRRYLQSFARVFDGFKFRLIKAQPFDQNKMVLKYIEQL